MAATINQVDVINALHNLMGHRVSPGGTVDDYNRYVQSSFDYCWRYFPWTFSLATGTIASDGVLPTDFDHEGFRQFSGITEITLGETLGTATSGSAVIWDDTLKRYKLTPAVAGTVLYQRFPPTLGTDASGAAPFPSAMAVAVGATVFAKQGANPTRADIQQEWDEFHSLLDRLAGRAFNNRPRKLGRSYHEAQGTFTGDVGN